MYAPAIGTLAFLLSVFNAVRASRRDLKDRVKLDVTIVSNGEFIAITNTGHSAAWSQSVEVPGPNGGRRIYDAPGRLDPAGGQVMAWIREPLPENPTVTVTFEHAQTWWDMLVGRERREKFVKHLEYDPAARTGKNGEPQGPSNKR